MKVTKRYFRILWMALLGLCPGLLFAQSVFIHSHNDYERRVPFYQAYAQQISSVEADIYATLDILVDKLKKYPEVFDPAVNPLAVRVVISGNAPEVADYDKYPSFISFGAQKLGAYTAKQLERIAMFSFNFRNYSVWNGKGSIVEAEKVKVLEVIEAGHANSLPGSIMETLSFDLAVAEALKFADSNGKTLVIVTGDHETGGLSLVDGSREQGLVVAQYSTDDHTPIMLPVYSYGPKSNKFIGVYENTQFFHTIKEFF
ncbi:hypothetical protein FACS1894199_08750 [Bacteroidia bacterium]|nr:hypothetical protein FACS1894199_08750 [Bacteroidia bacterium]